ncbi:MAG: hypothetical protein I3273_00295 [Candidatus Moeniiplasma glomeromycotorum]|nr:hypothetical protein [Candidatus Moeniiplasma glomeromycotorum]MCE8167431.1 hypothetical protein [Candidatus Moeniiplasma glomeromycotorum]MCE8168555.1 hypothetical protein [Candidatus Moeniiplasma glomeromycotorum]
MRSAKKITKLFNLIKNSLRILCVVIFLHWIFWFTTYSRTSQYYEAISPKKNEEITHHKQKTSKYNVSGLLSKRTERTIGEIEEDVLKQIEAETSKKDLPREWTKQLPELEKLDQETKELREKKNKNAEEEKELDQKEKNYREKLKVARNETIQNIRNQLKENNLKITELNDQRGLLTRLFIDPLKFFLISPFNKASKVSEIDTFPLAEIIFKTIVFKLFCLWLSYPESINARMQENYQKAQNPQLSVKEKEQIEREAASLSKYFYFNTIINLFFPLFFFSHPAYLDRTSKLFLDKVPYLYLLVPLLIIPFFLSVLSSEALRQEKILSFQEIKTYLLQNWFIFLLFPVIAAFAWQNQGIYLCILVSFGVDLLFNLVRLWLLHFKKNKPPSANTFKVTRVKGTPNSWHKAN